VAVLASDWPTYFRLLLQNYSMWIQQTSHKCFSRDTEEVLLFFKAIQNLTWLLQLHLLLFITLILLLYDLKVSLTALLIPCKCWNSFLVSRVVSYLYPYKCRVTAPYTSGLFKTFKCLLLQKLWKTLISNIWMGKVSMMSAFLNGDVFQIPAAPHTQLCQKQPPVVFKTTIYIYSSSPVNTPLVNQAETTNIPCFTLQVKSHKLT
jgi:hypothetical protein